MDIARTIYTAPSVTDDMPPLLRHVPVGISLLHSCLPSSSALREGTRLLVMGGVIESCRQVFQYLWDTLMDRLWITATFDDEDASYSWLLFWLSRRPVWQRAHSLEVTTRHYGLARDTSSHPWFQSTNESQDTTKAMSYLPTAGKTYWMWFNRRLMTVRRVPNQAPGIQLQKSETLQIRILAFSHRYLATLLEESRSEYRIAKEGVIAVFASNTMSNWVNITSNPKRALHTIILDPGVKEMLLDDARDFLRSQQWYTERGIPFRRGYLLYGAPGSGKTSMIQSIAGELGLDVYIVSLSRSGLDDNGLYQLIGGLPKRCIALMEDIDAAFKQGISRDLPPSIVKSTEGDGASSSPHTLGMSQKMAQASGVTLSGLLNALDGIGAQEGRLLFATTNDYSALDPALRRPGRMDVHVEFKLASKYQAEELFKCFFTPSVLRTAPPTAGVSGSSFDKDPGCGPDDISDLAKQFSEAIPERAISMASLQGHLMRYKLQPHDAVLATPKWVDEELGAPTTKSNPS